MYTKKQRIAALIGIILLLLLYIATFIIAIINPDGKGGLFQACLFATIAMPILLWIYIWLCGVISDRHTIASFQLFSKIKPLTEDTKKPEAPDKETCQTPDSQKYPDI